MKLLDHHLVLGGACSGKSAFAEGLVEAQKGDCLYIATADPAFSSQDQSMMERIALHQERRGPRWQSFEEPLDLPKKLQELARPNAMLLVDCLTLWVTNLMMAERDVAAACQELCRLVTRLTGPVVFVSNEVGLGIVPMDKTSRDFRDRTGRFHQDLAAIVPSVSFVTAGLPWPLKRPS